MGQTCLPEVSFDFWINVCESWCHVRIFCLKCWKTNSSTKNWALFVTTFKNNPCDCLCLDFLPLTNYDTFCFFCEGHKKSKSQRDNKHQTFNNHHTTTVPVITRPLGHVNLKHLWIGHVTNYRHACNSLFYYKKINIIFFIFVWIYLYLSIKLENTKTGRM